MKLLCLADLHGRMTVLEALSRLEPEYDVVVIAGDVLIPNQEARLVDQIIEIQRHLGVPFYVTPGNHDYWEPSIWDACDSIVPLIDETILLPNGWRAFFTPWSKPFCDWNWMRPDTSPVDGLTYPIPHDVKIIVSHGPAFGFLDQVGSQHTGSLDLIAAIDRLPDLRYVLTGHIHGWDYDRAEKGQVIFQNIACLNEDYQFKGKFISIELPDQ